MNNPFLSVIMPCYNAEAYLVDAIESVLVQQESDWELLLIDDGSTDKTPSICDEYSLSDYRIHVVHKRNEGVSVARNIGLGKAKGEWVCFLDADDWFSKSSFSLFKKATVKVTSEVHIFNNYQNKGDSEKKCPNYRNELFTRRDEDLKWFVIDTLFPFYDENINGINTGNIRAVHGKLYKMSYLRENKLLFNTELSIAEDALFNFFVYRQAKSITMHNDYVLHYRINPTSVMHKYNENIDNINVKILEKFEEAIGVIMEKDEVYRIAYLGMAAECIFRSLKLRYLNPSNTETFSQKKKNFVVFMSSSQIVKAMEYRNVSVLPVGKKQMMWFFMHKMYLCGMLVGKLSIIFLKHKGVI